VSKVEIKRASLNDLPAIRDLAAVIWHEHYPGIISVAQIDYMLARMYDLATLRREMQSEGVRFEKLLVAGALAGFASYGPIKPPGVWKLHKLYLLRAHHGSGLGSRLLQHCERAARAAGASRLVLNVNKRNTKAITAYERNGFTVAESMVLDCGGGYVMDDFVMAKQLR
jgi:GNAT superfamily N-acetyltransferase